MHRCYNLLVHINFIVVFYVWNCMLCYFFLQTEPLDGSSIQKHCGTSPPSPITMTDDLFIKFATDGSTTGSPSGFVIQVDIAGKVK